MQSIFPSISKDIIEEILNSKCIAIVSHKNPDGDALSSSLAMREIAKSLGKDAILLNDGPYDRKELSFLTKDFLTTIPEDFKARNPLVIVLDCSTVDRPGHAYKAISNLKTIIIDHHSSGKLFVPENLAYIVPNSPSTTLLVEELRVALGVELTKQMATYLYIGLVTDTGFFHFIEETASYTFYKASLFTSLGVNAYQMYDTLNGGRTIEELKYISSIIEGAKLFYDNKLAVLIEPEDALFTGVSDIIYQQILSLDKIMTVVFIKHRDDEFVLGFRSKRDSGLDVGSLAASIGGGGHERAAGATVDVDKKEILSFVVNLFKDSF